MDWFALHCRSCQEHLVLLQLEQAGVEGFYPHTVEKSRDQRRDVEKKFMPGYVFARFSLADKTPVVAIPQVVSIIGIGHHAIAIPASQIADVRLIVTSPKLVMPCEFLNKGDRVRIRYGPLTGLEGFLLYRKGKTHVVVSLSTLGRSIRTEVDAQCLEAAAVPAAA